MPGYKGETGTSNNNSENTVPTAEEMKSWDVPTQEIISTPTDDSPPELKEENSSEPEINISKQSKSNAQVLPNKQPSSSNEKEMPVIDSREMHEPQIDPRNLNYKPEKVVTLSDGTEITIETTDGADFPLNPNEKYIEKLSQIKSDDGKFMKIVKLLNVAGTDIALLDLLFRGIGSGLSHGTMDIIYRMGVGDRVYKVLDNLDIAVGSLQRRIIIADLLGKEIKNNSVDRVFSIAGGSCLLTIESIYQSGKEGLNIINVDLADQANKKAEKTLAEINSKKNIGLSLKFYNRDILENGLGEIRQKNGNNQIIECTGFWEYLEMKDRKELIEKVSESMIPGDTFVLTMLIDNPQQDIFDNIGFKKLRAHDYNDALEMINDEFNIKKAVITPNETYMTLVLTK
jgi:hypothetical protein